jgi:methionine synthase II (cobalamin-independent)
MGERGRFLACSQTRQEAKERGQPYDHAAFARRVRSMVAEVVRRQVEAGVDIVTDCHFDNPLHRRL